MVNYFDYAAKFHVFDDAEEKFIDVFGIAYTPDFYAYKNYFKKHIIKSEEQYRPDKIMFSLVGDQSLDWVLDCINHFTNGISEYYPGREIDYLDRDALRAVGVI